MSDDLTRELDQTESTDANFSHVGVKADHFEIGDEIASGGMGIVCRGRDLVLNREVAIKFLHDRYPGDGPSARRFLEEAQITGQLQHPGIPPIHHVGTLADGRPFLAMKLIRGQTLAELIEDRSPDARGRLITAFEKMAEAVAYAHAHGVIHRDLKPANVMVGTYGEVQVMDWGLAKLLTDSRRPTGPDPEATLGSEIRSLREGDDETQAGSILGTPAYMPPEQAIGAHDQVDARSDVFGLGAILCTILTGRPPYRGESSESTRQLAARAKLEDAFEALDRCGAEPEIVALCKRCLAAEPADRPADAGFVAREIAELRAAAIERARQAELEKVEAEVKTAEERKRRRIWNRSVGTIAGVLAVGVALSTWLAVRAREAEFDASHQLRLTLEAERKAREEGDRARLSESQAREAEALATEREAKERAARTEADNQKREAKEQAATAIAVKDFVCDVLIGTEPKKTATPDEIEKHRSATRRNLDFAVKRLDDLFDGKPTIEAEIRNTIGMMYDKIGAVAEAETQLKRSLKLYEEDLGAEHVTTLNAVNALAGFYVSHNREDDAKPLYIRTLKGFENDTGIGVVFAMQSCRHLILIGQSQKNVDDQITYHNRSIALSERYFGKDSDDALDRWLDLGRCYKDNKRFSEAEQVFRTTLDTAITKLGDGHPITEFASIDLEQCYTDQSKYELAELVLLDNVARKKKVLGPDNWKTRDAKRRLAHVHSSRGSYGKSITIFQELLRHPNTGVADSCGLLIHMGNDYLRAGQTGEAVRHLESAERIRRKHKSLANYRNFSHSSLEEAYRAIDRPDKIATLCRERTEELRTTFAPGSTELGNELVIQGKKLLELRQYRDAATLLRECLAIREKLGEDRWWTSNARSLLGGALSGMGEYDEAETLLVKGYEGLKAKQSELPENGRNNLTFAIELLILHYDRQARSDESAKWRTERKLYPLEIAPPPRPAK